MKALTIWQPWVSLIIAGAKPYEFRHWLPPASLIGHRIALHAGARKPKVTEVDDLIERLKHGVGHDNPCLRREEALELLTRARKQMHLMPLSAVIGTATLGKPKRGDECAREMGLGEAGNDSDRAGTFNWGWPMLDIEPWLPPVPAKGMQGLWNFGGSHV